MRPHIKNKEEIRNKSNYFSKYSNMFRNMVTNGPTKRKSFKLRGKKLIKYMKFT